MSNILEMLLSNNNGSTVKELSKQFDLPEAQTRTAVEELIPALSRGMQNNTSSAPGMDDLLAALRDGKHTRYMDDPSLMSKAETTKDGNDILGHIFGNKDVSREVTNRVSKKSGVSSTLLKKMLPVLATLAMGALSKGVLAGGNSNARSGSVASAGGGLVSSLLDTDRDGSIWDDVLKIAAKTMLR